MSLINEQADDGRDDHPRYPGRVTRAPRLKAFKMHQDQQARPADAVRAHCAGRSAGQWLPCVICGSRRCHAVKLFVAVQVQSERAEVCYSVLQRMKPDCTSPRRKEATATMDSWMARPSASRFPPKRCIPREVFRTLNFQFPDDHGPQSHW